MKNAHLVGISKNGRSIIHLSWQLGLALSSVDDPPINQELQNINLILNRINMVHVLPGATYLGRVLTWTSKGMEVEQRWTRQGMYHNLCLHWACTVCPHSKCQLSHYTREKDQLGSGPLKETKVVKLSGKRPTYSPWKSRGTCQDSTSFCWRTTTRTG